MLKQIIGSDKEDPLDDQIAAVLHEMDNVGVSSERYVELLRHLERLNELKTKNRRPPVSRDTIALIAGNLLGILVIVVYEQKHVIVSKGFSQVIQPMRGKTNQS